MEAAVAANGRRDRRIGEAPVGCRPDLIVFHCTDTSMTQGRRRRPILDIVKEATVSRRSHQPAVLEALQRWPQEARRAQPYRSNQAVIDYLKPPLCRRARRGARPQIARICDVTPREWTELARSTIGRRPTASS